MARTRLMAALRRALAKASAAARGMTPPTEPTPEAGSWSRREFVAATGAALGMLPLGALASSCGDDDGKKAAAGTRIAVIGGGIAGLHCAYRLMKDYNLRATVYDANTRAGGRMFTARGMFPNDQVAELGGEFIDTNHLTMHALAEEFDIQLDDRFKDEPAGYTREIFFFEGRIVPEEEIVEAFIPVAEVMNMTLAMAEEDDALFEEIDAMSIVDWLDSLGDTASDLIKSIIIEAYIGEYGLEATEQSIFNVLYFLDHETPDPFRIFGDSDERFHTHLGNDTFTTALAEALGDQVVLNTRLTAVGPGTGGAIKITLDQGGQTVEEEVDHLVLAIPFTTLREVDLSIEMSEDKRAAIEEIGYGTNAKLMMGFSAPVWRTEHNTSGSSFSDFGMQNTWDTTIGQEGATAIMTQFAGGTFGVEMGEGTPQDRADVVLPFIDQMFPGAQAAYAADSAVRMHWPTFPLAKGSYTCYKPGQWAFYGLEGERVGNVHFCGEHCSADFQGFMEGAAETGGLTAMEIAADLGMSVSEGGLRALGAKLLLPQPTWQAHRMKGLNWIKRRRIVKAILADLRKPR